MAKLKFKERDDDIVTLKKFSHALEAHSLRVLLEASGIHALVTGEEANSLIGLPLLPAGALGAGVEVRVRREDFETAKLVMQEVPAASDVLIPPWTCSCGADVDQGFSVCWSCGKDFDETMDANTTGENQGDGIEGVPYTNPEMAESNYQFPAESPKSYARHLFFGIASFVGGMLLPQSMGVLKLALVVAGCGVVVFALFKIALSRDSQRLAEEENGRE